MKAWHSVRAISSSPIEESDFHKTICGGRKTSKICFSLLPEQTESKLEGSGFIQEERTTDKPAWSLQTGTNKQDVDFFAKIILYDV